MNEALVAAQADMCRTFTHPIRIELLEALADGERSVSDLVDRCGIAQPTVSQHLAVLRRVGVVETRRQGTTVHYRIVDRRILTACRLVRAVLLDRMKRDAKVAESAVRASRRGRP